MQTKKPELPVLSLDALGDPELYGLLLVDKAQGWSSFDVVKRLRRLSGIKKIGHAGTLDPMATGLLICLLGSKATRAQDAWMNEDKVYTGVMRFGQTTDSYDAETPIHEERILPANFEEALVQALPLFSGDITQEVPIYSAVKKGGKRLYRYARAGEEVTLPKRNVTIKRFTVTMINDTDASFEVACSKGTYIRSLAHELGQHLGVGAHLIALRRTMIGNLSVAEASRLDQETTSMD